MVTIERLKELLRYDPASGVWTRIKEIGNQHETGLKRGKFCPVGSVANYLNKKQGYMQVGVDGRTYRASRLAWFYMTGEWPTFEIDHEDRDRANDRWGNLRPATHAQNMANRKTPANNALGVKGVRLVAGMKSRPYRARIMANGKSVHLGYFETSEEANAAYAAAANRYFSEFGAAA